MLDDNQFTLPLLTKWHQSRLLNCAERVLMCQQQMTTKRGKNILHYTLQKNRRHVRNIHYPIGDRIDTSTGGQFFYHCHREDMELEEHGHFHCFLRYDNIPKRIKPKKLLDWDKYISNPIAHIVAISMNRLGQPIRLFTVNRWVTSEIWYDASHVTNFIRRFNMRLSDDPHWVILDQWVDGMLKIFAPQIAWLHQQRDKVIDKHIVEKSSDNVYEDRKIEELSDIRIDLNQQIQWILTSV
jgi:hypothetical protein